MAKTVETSAEDVADGKIKDIDKYVYEMYVNQIDYYKRSGSYNKKYYKNYRSLTIILGALVTLIASLASSKFIATYDWLEATFMVATPLLAFTLTVINGLSQNFQWGATWRDMMVNRQRLEKERDRFLSTPVEKRNYKAELKVMNDIVLEEIKAFFQRILDSEVVPTASPDDASKKL